MIIYNENYNSWVAAVRIEIAKNSAPKIIREFALALQFQSILFAPDKW
jgi:hypothetical protein